MPILGLPNARVHRLCRRCQQWHQPWEGHYEWPRVSGPLSWLRISIAKRIEDDTVMIWVCDGCKVEHHAKRQPLPGWLGPVIAMAVMALAGGAAWLFKDDLLAMLGLGNLGL